MGFSNDTISAPVSVSDINQALGNGSQDVGTLCSDANNINMWAKYKPVRLATTGVTGKTSGNNYWQGQGNCGISIQPYSDLGSPTTSGTFLYKLYNESTHLKWTIELPTGGIGTAPYRMLDFDGYRRTCRNPLGSLATSTIWVQSGNATLAYDYITVSNDNIKYSDISVASTPLTSFYPAVLLVSGNTWLVVSSTSTLSANDFQVTISNADSLVGTWNAIPFLSSVVISQRSSTETGTFISMNVPNVEQIEIKSAGGIANFSDDTTAVYHIGTGYLDIDAMLFNEKGVAQSFDAPVYCQIYRRLAGTTGTPSTYGGSFTIASSSVTVAAHGTGYFPTFSSSSVFTYVQNYEYFFKLWTSNGITSEGYFAIEIDEPMEML